jgi:hypothetical protein
MFPDRDSTRCCRRPMAEGRTSGFGSIICCNNKEIKITQSVTHGVSELLCKSKD